MCGHHNFHVHLVPLAICYLHSFHGTLSLLQNLPNLSTIPFIYYFKQVLTAAKFIHMFNMYAKNYLNVMTNLSIINKC